jgi:hypothetical protein
MAYASRQRGGGWAPRSKDTFASQRKHSQPTVELPRGPCLSTIAHGDLQIGPSFDRASASINSCEYMASYSWMNAKSATIMVPGEPIHPVLRFKLLTYSCTRETSAVVTPILPTTAQTRFRGLLPRPKCCSISTIPNRTGSPGSAQPESKD